MKNRINFYQKSLRVKHDPMPLSTVLICWCIASAVMLFFWSVYVFQTSLNTDALAQNEQQLASAKRELEHVKLQLAKKQEKQPLINELKSIEQLESHKKQIFSYLAEAEIQSSTDYAQVMHDLAKYHQPHVWLTQFMFVGQQVTIQGGVSDAQYLPIWLKNLKQSRFFNGKAFSVVEFDHEEGLLTFKVASELSLVKGQP